MFKVTYKAQYQVKEKRKLVNKVSIWTEDVKSEADARLRAMALNWTIVSLEKVG